MCGKPEYVQLFNGEVLIRFGNTLYRRERVGSGLVYTPVFTSYPEADGDYGVPVPYVIFYS